MAKRKAKQTYVIVTVQGGVAEVDIEGPDKNIEIVTIDYDVEGSDTERICECTDHGASGPHTH